MRVWQWFALSLVAAVLCSALAVIYSQHQSRSLFVQLQRQDQQIDNLDIHWGQLLLEQSTWATQVRVQQVAEKNLGMHMPATTDIAVVTP